MNRIILVPSLCASLVCALPAKALADDGNGQVVEVGMPGAAAVAFRILFTTGSIDDPRGKEGLTSLTAKLMAEGGTERLTYPQLLKALYPLASKIEVSVDREQTVFSGQVHPDHAARFAPILAEAIMTPRLPESDLSRIRDEMINDIEKRLRATDDENLGKAMLNLMLYPGDHPYGHYVGGTVKGLRSITLDDVRAHSRRVFGKRRMLIGVGGATSPEIRAQLASALASLQDGDSRLASIPSPRKQPRTEVWIAEKPVKAVAISMGFTHEAKRGHPDFHDLALVQSYFGEHRQFHGILMSEMREKRGLNYGDYAYVENFAQDGWSTDVRTNIARRQQHFEIWIRPVDPKDAVFSIRLATYLLDRLIKEGVSEKGVEDTRRFLEGYTRLWDLTPMRKLGWALDDRFYGVSGYLDGYRKALGSMTKAGVDAVVRRHLRSSALSIAVVAPDAQALKTELVSASAASARVYAAKVDSAVLEMDKKAAGIALGIRAEDIRIMKADDLFNGF